MPKKNKKPKTLLKKIWHFLWEDNSMLSWIVNVVLAFIIIKFLLYPGLGLLMGTGYPIVAVVSNSMEHQQNFDFWWGTQALCNNTYCTQETYYSLEGVSEKEFKEFPFKNGFNKGDIMFLMGEKPKNIKKGDVIVFQANRADPIIHRVIDIWYEDNEYHFRTKGDNNPRSFQEILETDITEDRIIGKSVIRIPFLGWVKIAFVDLINLLR
jgi:signal peptidase I